MACAFCGRVLDYWEGKGWEHSLTQLDVDHPAVPAPVDQVQALQRCDFCYKDGPEWEIPARSFRANDISQSAGSWSACEDCASLIRLNQWNALVRRVVASWESRYGPAPDGLEAGMKRLYRKLRENMTGSPRRMQ